MLSPTRSFWQATSSLGKTRSRSFGPFSLGPNSQSRCSTKQQACSYHSPPTPVSPLLSEKQRLLETLHLVPNKPRAKKTHPLVRFVLLRPHAKSADSISEFHRGLGAERARGKPGIAFGRRQSFRVTTAKWLANPHGRRLSFGKVGIASFFSFCFFFFLFKEINVEERS